MPNPLTSNHKAFGLEQGSFEQGARVAAQAAAGGNHAVIREPGFAGLAKNVAHGPRRARATGQPRDISVRDHAADGNPLDD